MYCSPTWFSIKSGYQLKQFWLINRLSPPKSKLYSQTLFLGISELEIWTFSNSPAACQRNYLGWDTSLTEVNMSIKPSTKERSRRKNLTSHDNVQLYTNCCEKIIWSYTVQKLITFLSLIHYNVSGISDDFHRPVTAAFVVSFSIIRADCTSRIQLSLIKEINQLAIKNVGLIAPVKPTAVCCFGY